MNKKIDGFSPRISLIDYMAEVCPSCYNVSPYNPNPMYMHKCKNEDCDFEGYQSDLIKVINDYELEEDIVEIRKTVKESNLIKFSELKNAN